MTVETVVRRLTPRHLLLLAPWVGLAVGAAKPIGDNSFLWHVRAGTLQLELGRVLQTDPFSFTMQGQPWRTQSWLLELAYGLLERWTGGLSWTPIFLVVVGATTFGLVALSVHRRSRNLAVTGLIMVGLTWLGLAFQSPRPVLLSYLLLVALVAALERDLVWMAPLVMWVWAASHGSWIVGLGYIVLEFLASRRSVRQLGRTLAASLVLATLTAQGLGVWAILIDFFRNREALSFIQEWAIPSVISLPVLPYTLGVILLVYGASRGRLASRDLWVAMPFAIFGLTAGRSLMPAALVLAPWVASQVRIRETKTPVVRVQEVWVNAVLALVFCLGPLLTYAFYKPSLSAERFPVAASRWLDAGPAWHDDATGGFLIYSAWPDRQVYIDDRAELYGPDLMEGFIRSREGAAVWRDIFAKYDIRQALTKAESGLSESLRLAGWNLRYSDETWSVWSHPEPSG